MITGELKNKVDKIWEIFWTGGITNPLEVIEQFNYLLFIKQLDEVETRNDHLEMIRELIHLGISIDASDNNNETALFIATRSEDKELINTLFEDDFKADLNHQNNQGDTVLSILALNGIRNADLIKLYLRKGANPDLEVSTSFPARSLR